MSMLKCFVAMPFDGSCDSPYHSAIRPACADLAVDCHRIDLDLSEDSIIRQVVSRIYDADIVIANITGGNPNVLYEVGISHTLPYRNKTIMIAKRGTNIPFDIGSHRIILYKETPRSLATLKKQLKQRISALAEGDAKTSNPVQDNIGYYERLVLPQNEATRRHGITLDNALATCQSTLVLIGTTLFSVRNQPARRKIMERVRCPEFRELSLVLRDPGSIDVSLGIRRHLKEFTHDESICELLELNRNDPKIHIYFCRDFLRFSATYIDHEKDFGSIRITHSIYGSLMEHAPSYWLTKRRSPMLHDCYVRAWNDLKDREGTKEIATVEEFVAFRDDLE